MMLRVLLSQIICAAAILLLGAALPSAACAHEGHEHAAAHAAFAKGPQDNGPSNQAVVGPAETKSVTWSPASSALDAHCTGMCCGFGCCGGCMMVLAQDISQVPPLTLAGTRIAVPEAFGGPGTVPEALPRPPKSFA